jgi:hypothetical protein
MSRDQKKLLSKTHFHRSVLKHDLQHFDLTVRITEALGVVPTQVMQILSRDGKENQTGKFEQKSIGRNI